MLARVLITIALIGTSSVTTGTSTCDTAGVLIGGCTVTNTGSQVDIGASQSGGRGGNSGTDGAGQNTGAGDGSGATDDGAPSDRRSPECIRDLRMCPYTIVVRQTPDPTLNDIASFRPFTPTLDVEPAGVGVAGLPTNILAQATEHTLSGTVLGRPAQVRFTPIAYRFDYGDGRSQTTSTPGGRWTSLGQAQFTPTPTSHTYAQRGTYTLTASVDYAASVSFGTDWRDVAGTVTARTDPYSLRILEPRTALVDRTCTENPSGPGC